MIKPALETPLTALALGELAQRAGFPPGVLNIVTGDAAAIGKVFCEHPAVRFVGFTGSTEVGKLLMRQAASGVKKVGLELGGNAPFIVFDDADLDAAVAGAMAAKYRNMGQTCVCANRIYVQEAVYDAFAARLAEAAAKLKVGDGTAGRRATGAADHAEGRGQGRGAYRRRAGQGRARSDRRQAARAGRHIFPAHRAGRRHPGHDRRPRRNFWACGAACSASGTRRM